jgi:heparanase 1
MRLTIWRARGGYDWYVARAVLPCLAFGAALVCQCSSSSSPSTPAVPTRTASPLTIDTTAAIAQIDERFLAVGIDSAQVVGATWWSSVDAVAGGTAKVAQYDFARPVLRKLASALAPSYLRIGGTEADKIFYDMSATPVTTAPSPYVDVLTHAQWDAIHDFATTLGFEVLFTLDAGPGPRAADMSWQPDNARVLLQYAASKGTPVALWELGNEVNAFPVSVSLSYSISPAQLAADVKTARALVDATTPGVKLGAPSSAYWPKQGELPGPFYAPFMMAGGGDSLDVITWHYYPTQSHRCPIATVRDAASLMFEPSTLDEIDTWAQQVQSASVMYAANKPVWLGETGNAQCGGKPGVSDAFVGGFWWLDQLAKVARLGQPVMVRQTLSGSNYGLIDDTTLTPRPDFWTAVLWRRLMGTSVLAVTATTPGALLRTYAHCTRAGAPGYAKGAVTLVVLNLDQITAVSIPIATGMGDEADVYELSSQDVSTSSVMLNGTVLTAAADGSLPALNPSVVRRSGGTLNAVFGPAMYGYVVLPGANAAACD